MPDRRPDPGERRDETRGAARPGGDPAGLLTELLRRGEQAQVVAEPAQRRTRRGGVGLQAVVADVALPPAGLGEHPGDVRPGQGGRGTGRRVDERAGPVHAHALPGGQAAERDQCGVLVAHGSGQWDGDAEGGRVGRAESGVVRAEFRKQVEGEAQMADPLLVPGVPLQQVTPLDAALVGVVACTAPPVRRQISQVSTVPKSSRPSRWAAATSGCAAICRAAQRNGARAPTGRP